jgi:hypothetical protein
VIGLIFLFQSGIYPCLERIVVLTPLRKMVAGGLIASLAFLISGFVQLMANVPFNKINKKTLIIESLVTIVV